MKQKRWSRKKYFCKGTAVLVLLMMIGIFHFSGENAQHSSVRSTGISIRMMDAADRYLHLNMKVKDKEKWADYLETPIRKGAHFTEYALLSFFTGWHIFAQKILREKKT